MENKKPVTPCYYEYVLQLTRNRGHDLLDVAALTGGWEGWAQVELGVICHNAGQQFERERAVFKDSDYNKADFGFYQPLTIMELKCKTLTESPQAFAERLVKDVKKLAKLKQKFWNSNAGVGVVGLWPPTKPGQHDVQAQNAIHKALTSAGNFEVGQVKLPIVFKYEVGGHNIGIWWWWANIKE